MYSNDDLEDIRKQLELIPTGFMFYNFVKEQGQKEESFINFVIKEDKFRLSRIKPIVYLETVSIGISIDEVFFVDVLMKFQDITDTLYECHINAKDTETGKLFIEKLSVQDKLYMTFFDEHNNFYRHIAVINKNKKDFTKFKFKLMEWLDWDDDQFMTAKDKFLNKFPDTFELWKKYSKNKKV